MKITKGFSNLFKANKYYLKYMLSHGKLLLLLQVMIILLGIPLNIIQLYAPRNFINSILLHSNFGESMKWIILLVLSQIAYYIISSAFNIYRQYVCGRAKLVAKEYTYKHFLKLYLSYFDDNEKLNKIQRALAYGENGGEAFFLFLFSQISVISSLSVVTYVSLKFDWWFWIVIIGTFFAKLFISNMLKKISFVYQKEKTIRNRQIGYYSGIITNKDALSEIKIYNSSEFFLKKHRDIYLEDRNKQLKFDVKVKFLSLIEQIPEKLLDIVSYSLIGIKLLNNSATIGDYTMFFSMLAQINALLNNFKGNLSALYEHSLQAENYCDFMNDTSHLLPSLPNTEKVNKISSIKMENVCFMYSNQQCFALNKVNLEIKPGERVAIVGLNGAGKSTLVKLLLLLYQPSEGCIKINNKDAALIDYESYYNRIGVLFQNHHEYAITLAENLVFSENYELQTDRIWNALELVDLKEKIIKFPEKLDTPLTHAFYENGVDLSGGERQKLSIARTLVRECDLYIFDEPSSALDAKAEDELFEFFNSVPKSRSIIFISHRLSSSVAADRVVVMKDGKIIASAPHDILIQTCEEYREMYTLQAKRYT